MQEFYFPNTGKTVLAENLEEAIKLSNLLNFEPVTVEPAQEAAEEDNLNLENITENN